MCNGTGSNGLADLLHKQGFANEEIYLERHGKYFDLWDTKNCERNYKAIKEM